MLRKKSIQRYAIFFFAGHTGLGAAKRLDEIRTEFWHRTGCLRSYSALLLIDFHRVMSGYRLWSISNEPSFGTGREVDEGSLALV